jgi:predicted regulator of Ras-like GTPase activity (Roadblock/LC7/MglB family)
MLFNHCMAGSNEKLLMARFLLKECDQAHLPVDRPPVEYAYMSKSVKIKIAGLLRGVLRHLDPNEAFVPQTPRFHTSTSSPVTAVPVAATPTPTVAPTPVENADGLQLPLQPIIAALPMELRAKVLQTPPAGMVISIPLDKILTQLARGAVKISFGELRMVAPGVFVNSGGEHDHKPVMLPLNEILTRLNPALLARRGTQKHVELTDDIGSPFGALGQGIKISTTPVKPPAASPAPPQQTVTPPIRMPTPPSRSVTPSSQTVTPPSRMVTPVGSSASIQPPPPPPAPRIAPVTMRIATPQNNNNGVPKPAAKIAPAAPPVPMEPAVISAPLAALSEDWPEGLRLEITKLNLSNAQVLLPGNLIEPALKRGRVTFTWQNLRPLIKPTPPPASIHDGIELELPLKVIAPLFLTRQKAASRPQQAALPPDDIPILFFGFPQPQTEAPALETTVLKARHVEAPAPIARQAEAPVLETPVPEAPVKAPVPAVNRPVLKPVDAKLADSNYYIWGETNDTPRLDETEYKHPQKPATDFTSRYATPQEIITRAMALPGVAGALVVLPDGLKVASQIPSDLNADTLAAFLPQIYDRVSQSTKELRMGPLNNFNFTVGNVPWKIFRVNAVYFAAFGRAGEALPTAQLAALAAELNRKKQ